MAKRASEMPAPSAPTMTARGTSRRTEAVVVKSPSARSEVLRGRRSAPRKDRSSAPSSYVSGTPWTSEVSVRTGAVATSAEGVADEPSPVAETSGDASSGLLPAAPSWSVTCHLYGALDTGTGSDEDTGGRGQVSS